MRIEYHNLYTHLIFTTQNRFPIIQEKHRERIDKYITRIVNNHHSKLYSIYANPEHVHILLSRSPHLSEEDMATIVTDSSAKFINENSLCQGLFAWQQSASAFSVSKSDVDKVCKYILAQPEHHKKVSFAEEYNAFLKHYQQTIKWEIRKRASDARTWKLYQGNKVSSLQLLIATKGIRYCHHCCHHAKAIRLHRSPLKASFPLERTKGKRRFAFR
ncbi:transposase [Flavisolibacter ginsenosidimutans]|uniref:Transposase IS200-like domain-containing protein n=1 Tax=Flavisolibacter ginsenosidimutans TaxID=661481 RepID=A0A5B8UM59_9BACT|nr:transposase [Flavisolibacter ginsenosidimutans]QEC57643.1 hypothetical protein FSB75_17620 [Flavisolibacter ginsenosidimutans]